MDPDLSDASFIADVQKVQRNYAKFYLHPVLNKNKSREAGRDIYEDKLYILIMCPGQLKGETRRPAQDKDKRDYPQAWLDFKNGNEQPTVVGTPIEYLGISPARAKELRSLHIHTVEQMADCADTASKDVGMDYNTLKNAAKSYLSKTSPELEAMKRRVAELEALLAAKPKPGRPRKADVQQVAA